MEFLHSFLSHHFAGKPVVASQNVSCFLKLRQIPTLVRFKFPVYSRKIKPIVRNFEKKKQNIGSSVGNFDSKIMSDRHPTLACGLPPEA